MKQVLSIKYLVLRVKDKGFTLIELLVVISIIGLLAGLIISNVAGVRERARDVQRKSDLDQIKKALRMYYNDNNSYPTSIPTAGSQFSGTGGMVYMKSVPGDPSTGSPYSYYQNNCSNGTEDFRLVATLENKSDPGISSSQKKCPQDCGATYSTDSYVVCAD